MSEASGFFTVAASADASPPLAADWRALTEPLLTLGERVSSLLHESNAQLQHELYHQLWSGLSMGYLAMCVSDADHPDFWPLISQAHNYLGPNPDTTYYLAPLDGRGIYRLSGFRGTVRTIDVQFGGGRFFTHGDGLPGANFASFDLDILHFDADGAFDVVLSGERPTGHGGDWWQLDPGVSYVMVRQTAYDWLREIDGRFAIERLDTPAIRPRPSAEQIAAQLRQLVVWSENWTATGLRWAGSYRKNGYVNKVLVRDLSDVGGVSDQQYIEGEFELAPDEALILETQLPERCHYWNVQLTDLMWAALDYTHRQTSINGHQAWLDADGRFRAVISAVDPGVPNWLDTAGYTNGTIVGRWTRARGAPVPVLTKIKLADLHRHLPADTPTTTAAQRDTTIRQRRKGLQLRRRW